MVSRHSVPILLRVDNEVTLSHHCNKGTNANNFDLCVSALSPQSKMFRTTHIIILNMIDTLFHHLLDPINIDNCHANNAQSSLICVTGL